MEKQLEFEFAKEVINGAIDSITNKIMDIVREEMDLNSDSDKDDVLYGRIHMLIRTLVSNRQ